MVGVARVDPHSFSRWPASSAPTAGAIETRAWEKTSAPLESRQLESLQVLNLHQQKATGRYDDALESPLAAEGTGALTGKMQDLTQVISKEPGYDCSEAAEALYNSNGQTGQIIRIEPKVANGLNEITVPINRQNTPFVYHEAYTDGRFVYDPFVSPNPIPQADYLANMAKLNPDATVLFKKP